ncbi:sugar kinase [Silicimonas algicola]|uniref:2-keto-3-deoxygluconate kinase n=1 Tax=Silicimonas algicola TaxID=1826607 RepID=A0A316GNV9_9RHOB|nr:sugar kinase [Silicimonas algicola]AZQ65676.1 sugar kinase [Silicimonas algicola]PWK56617.1 2-keto-3-deoxygluconate kinase [Silicimonas algicola]
MTDAVPDILAIGEPLIEMVRLPQPIDARPAFVQGFGGDTSTAMIAAARQKARTGYISAVGDDMFGQAMLALWDREGVDRSGVRVRSGDPTGVCFIDPDPAGRRFTYARRGSAASLFTPEDLPETLIRAARILHVSGISMAISATMRAAVFRAVDVAREAGVRVSLDVNFRPALWPREAASEAILRVAQRAAIIFPSDDEMGLLWGLTEPRDIADRFIDLGAEIVAVKQGAKGVYLAEPSKSLHIDAAPSTPIDSAGAGDSFAGAFLAWLVETSDPERAAREAVKVAAGTVGGLGAVEPIPRRTG